ncbi:unnamed protein product [Rhizoctonia solani]|uniref:Uncharacterized protein n=1 Tax=Rhizoctonia solani TaxID=456999 RepID=A0A8H3BER0_9AGAM|nr:unnamed protein product [Rhizoctonia solani]
MLPGISLEPEAFSCLRSLTLYDFGAHATLSILNSLASTADLTQLTLEINHITNNSDEVSSVGRFYNTMLIPAICAQAPRLTHLSIRPMWKNESQVEIDNSSLRLLASLNLKSFTSARTHTNVEYLAKLFPQIQTLRWPDQPVTLDQLKQFATYDQLEHLSLKLDLSPPCTMKPPCDRALTPPTLCVLESDYSSFDSLNHDETRQLLKRLARLGSRPLALQQTAPFDYPNYDFAAKKRLEELNKKLERIHQGVEI